MVMLWLPNAIKDPHGKGLPFSETSDPKGCLHTTESMGWPGYAGWTSHPHGTIMPIPGKGVTIRQHVPLNRGSFSLRHTQAQATNTDFVFQWELIGTCDPSQSGRMYFWPKADDAVLRDLARKLIVPLSNEFGIPLVAPKFVSYPASYGDSGVRMSNSRFDNYSGWLGHQHVPQNDHGDPGSFPWARLIELTKPVNIRPPQEVDMPLTIADADLVVKRLMMHLIQTGWQKDGTYDPNKRNDVPVGVVLADTYGAAKITQQIETPPA